MRRKRSKIKSAYNRWRIVKGTMHVGTYLFPLVPSGIQIYMNWNAWFQTSNKWSVGMGFGSLLVTVLITIVGVAKRDEILKQSISPIFFLALVMACWGITLMFLASIADQFGAMLLFTSFGILGGAVCDQVNKAKVSKEVEFYKKTLTDTGLLRSAQKEKERKAKIRLLAEEEAKRRATE